MLSLLVTFSSWMEYFSSCSLRLSPASPLRVVAAAAAAVSPACSAVSWSMSLTYCWVRVEAPWVLSPDALDTSARRTPWTSTPPCS